MPGESRTATTTSAATGTRHAGSYDAVSCESRWAGWAMSRIRRPRRGRVWFVRDGTGPADRPPGRARAGGRHDVKARRPAPPRPPARLSRPASDDGGATTRLIVVAGPLPSSSTAVGRGGGRCSCTHARSSASWGIGDLGTYARSRVGRRGLGAGYLAVNPLHAAASGPRPGTEPVLPEQPAVPHPLYLRIEDVPGFDPSDETLSDAAPWDASSERLARHRSQPSTP